MLYFPHSLWCSDYVCTSLSHSDTISHKQLRETASWMIPYKVPSVTASFDRIYSTVHEISDRRTGTWHTSASVWDRSVSKYTECKRLHIILTQRRIWPFATKIIFSPILKRLPPTDSFAEGCLHLRAWIGCWTASTQALREQDLSTSLARSIGEQQHCNLVKLCERLSSNLAATSNAIELARIPFFVERFFVWGSFWVTPSRPVGILHLVAVWTDLYRLRSRPQFNLHKVIPFATLFLLFSSLPKFGCNT